MWDTCNIVTLECLWVVKTYIRHDLYICLLYCMTRFATHFLAFGNERPFNNKYLSAYTISVYPDLIPTLLVLFKIEIVR